MSARADLANRARAALEADADFLDAAAVTSAYAAAEASTAAFERLVGGGAGGGGAGAASPLPAAARGGGDAGFAAHSRHDLRGDALQEAVPRHDLLFARAAVIAHHRAASRAGEAAAARAAAHPALSRRSLEIAASLPPARLAQLYRAPPTAAEAAAAATAARSAAEDSAELTFKPATLRRSSLLAARRHPAGVPASERLYAESLREEERRQVRAAPASGRMRRARVRVRVHLRRIEHFLQLAPPPPCSACKKKVGLTGFDCRCGAVFCALHRYADQHACPFDYKTHDKSILSKNNQRVVGEKVEKI
jgi:hypothetical protein